VKKQFDAADVLNYRPTFDGACATLLSVVELMRSAQARLD
jgi:hypothetical protein